MTQVAIQGEEGSYSHEAAVASFGPGVNILPCPTFPAVFAALADGRARRAVVPVKNTIIGPIGESAALVQRSPVLRSGETRLQVDHCLLVADETGATDTIRRVASHPMALAQCAGFLGTNPGWEAIETTDTAGAARALAEGRLAADAVIASRHAAERYGCQVLRWAIQDEIANFTTFVILESPEDLAGRWPQRHKVRDLCWREDRPR